MKKTLQKIPIAGFSILFLISMLVLNLVIIKNNNALVFLVACLAVLALLFVLYKCSAYIDAIGERRFMVFLLVTLLLYFLLSAFVADAIKFTLPSDTAMIMNAANNFLNLGTLNVKDTLVAGYFTGMNLQTSADYFHMYPNNILFFLLISAIYKVGGLFGFTPLDSSSQTIAIVFTSACIVLTILLMCLIVKHITKRNTAVLLTLIMCIGFVPFMLGGANFYTDFLVLLPMFAGIYIFFCSAKKTYLTMALCGLCFGVAIMMKMTAAIMLIALVITLLFEEAKIVKRAALLGALLAGCFAFIFTFSLWYKNSAVFDFANAAHLKMPVELWLCFGAHGDGAYNFADHVFTYNAPLAQRAHATLVRTLDYYRAYSFPEFLRFNYYKLLCTWNMGLFEMDVYARWPLGVNWSHFFMLPNQVGYFYMYWYSQAYVVFLYLGALFSAAAAVLKKSISQFTLFLHVSIFGTMFYLAFFETAPRRALIAMPLIIIATALWYSSADEFLKSKYKQKRLKPEKQV